MVVTSGRVGYGGGGGLFISTAVRGVTLEGCVVSCEATAVSKWIRNCALDVVEREEYQGQVRMENHNSKLKARSVSCVMQKVSCMK